MADEKAGGLPEGFDFTNVAETLRSTGGLPQARASDGNDRYIQ